MIGLDPALFGKHPNGSAVEAGSLCVQAPSVIEVRLPADLVAGAEFVGGLEARGGVSVAAEAFALSERHGGWGTGAPGDRSAEGSADGVKTGTYCV